MENLQRQFFYLMEKSVKSYRQYAQQQLKKHGLDITVDQWLVLKSLHDHPDITQIELSELVFKDKASITRIVEILVKSGYIKKGQHSTDKRQHHLTITAKGNKLIQKVIPVVLEYRKNAMQGLLKEELVIAEKVLLSITDNCRS